MSWADETGRFFDGWAEAGRGERMAAGHARLVERTLPHLELGADARLLDLGCGVGRALEQAQASGAVLAGVDASAQMIERARARLPQADLRACSADALPFADAAFTHVLSVEAIYYFEDPLAVFREVTRVLAPGGRVALALELFAENEGSRVWKDVLEIPVHLRSSQEWCATLREAGLEEVRAERIRCHGEKEWGGPSPYFPSQAMFDAYVEAGALLLLGRRA